MQLIAGEHSVCVCMQFMLWKMWFFFVLQSMGHTNYIRIHENRPNNIVSRVVYIVRTKSCLKYDQNYVKGFGSNLLSLVPIIRSGNRPGLPGVVRCEHSDWLSDITISCSYN